MKEIGGYIEMESYTQPMLHAGAIRLNCGRNALWYLCKAKKIKKIALPKFLCDSVADVCRRAGVETRFYSVGMDFLPRDIIIDPDEWLYIVNYYGQLANKVIVEWKEECERIVVDNAQAYFQTPVAGVDTLYTCRKFFGVSDGAVLYTDQYLDEKMPQDESFERMRFLLGRFERTAGEFYQENVENNERFSNEPIKTMSKLTENLLHAIDYESVCQRRTENFKLLNDAFADWNRLELIIPNGAFMYPLYISDGSKIRKELQKQGIFVPTLWPDVMKRCSSEDLEYDMADNILPLPVDQRYGEHEMVIIQEAVNRYLTK